MTGKPTKNNAVKLSLLVMFQKDIQKKRVLLYGDFVVTEEQRGNQKR